MIRWCAYCQTYQGEKPPLDDYSFTHTLCAHCATDASRRSRDAIARLEPVRDFFHRLARPVPGDSPIQLVAEALDLGVAPIDLLLGIVQPVLYDVGERWERGEATIEDEREVTRRCVSVYDALLARQRRLATLRRKERPDVLLACAPGNHHSLGLRVIELFLISEGLSVHTELEPRSVSELVELIRTCEPRAVGLSAALPEHLDTAAEVASRAKKASAALIFVGGRAVEPGDDWLLGTALLPCDDFRELPSLVRDLLHDETPPRISP